MLSWVPPIGVVLRSAAALLVVVVVVGFLAMWGGFYSVAASRGHWPGFEVMLEFAMRSSVRTHAMWIDVPPTIDEPQRLRRGAAHFQQGCAHCHASPDGPSMLVGRTMLPPPSDLKDLVPTWTAKELFWIVKNGLKYTGMPSWPAQQRDDEVWDVVAFLIELPAMSRSRYRELAGFAVDEAPSRTPNEARLAACAHCHGANGRGGDTTAALGAFPRLDIQTAPYLLEQLQSYASDRRASGFMQAATAELSVQEMTWLAEHFARRRPAVAATPLVTAPVMPDAQRRQGEALFNNGAPDRDVPPCVTCHGANAAGRDRRYPALLGQHAGHTRTQLELFKQGKRNRTDAARLMTTIAQRMTDEEIRVVAAWLAAEPAARE
jgi:cytochrome c553